MRNAPSVIYPVGRCVFHAGLLLMLGVLSAGVGIFYFSGLLQQTDEPGTWFAVWVGALVWLGWAVLALSTWLRSPAGTLKWDARSLNEKGGAGTWFWCDAHGFESVAMVHVECVLDLQNTILLHCRSGSEGQRWRWIWLERGSHAERWADLRRALVCSRV